jgi:transposase InsO family protein
MDLTAQALPRTKSGNEYILVVKDRLTRYVELFALKNKEPLTVARALLQVFSRHGAIRNLVSDQGGEFLNKTIEQLSALLTIKRFTTTPYVPRANGQVENHNLTSHSVSLPITRR